MTAAVVALAIAMLAATGGLISLGVLAVTATRRAGNEQAAGAALAVRMEVAIANAKNESARANAEKERADALDAAIARLAADLPVDGAYARLLEEADRARARAADRRGPAPVRDAGAPSEPASEIGPDDLLPPGA